MAITFGLATPIRSASSACEYPWRRRQYFDALADAHPVADSRVVNWDVADVLSCEELAGLAVLFHGDFLTVDYCIDLCLACACFTSL